MHQTLASTAFPWDIVRAKVKTVALLFFDASYYLEEKNEILLSPFLSVDKSQCQDQGVVYHLFEYDNSD
jgi:hypothetical protein